MIDIFRRKNCNESEAENAALALENEALKKQIQELLTLDETGVFAELDQLLKIILNKALIICDASASFFSLMGEDPTKLNIRVNNSVTLEELETLAKKFTLEYIKWTETEAEVIEIDNFVLLPLVRRHRMIGLIGLKIDKSSVNNLHDLLPLLASKSAASLESAMLYDKMFQRLLVLSNVFILGKEIVSNIELKSLVDKFLSIASDGTGSEVAGLFLVKGRTDLPYFTRLQKNNCNLDFAPNTLDGYTELIQAVRSERKLRMENNLENTEFAEFEVDKVPGTKLRNTLAMPLKTPDKLLGIIQVANKLNQGKYSSEDIDLLNILSSQLAFVIQNADLFSNLQKAYIDTLSALTGAIDAKDSYTRGHSERVTELSIKLAEECNVPSSEIENIKLGGLLHDIGKIGIPEAVLNKPGRLNDEEFNIIKSHPDLGLHILGKVEFLEHIVPIIRHHHERYDGKGYPGGLKGDNIPLLARIVSVVDTFDAMTTNRPYRKALTIEESLVEIDRCSGSQFDPDIAAKFIKMVRRDGIHFDFGDMSLPQTYETIQAKAKGN
ncbi:MAG: HD domain-containing protein [Candidatus Riflebacteria bacterium]|nr:HD domain-containing protein [Candidatus Riflebacteria bacterium]NCB46842.1 HD domain-containing protein [bacterium]